MNRFKKFGTPTGRPVAGYVVATGVKSYADWTTDDTLTPIIREAARLLKETLDCTTVADWLNEQKVAVGPYCRRKDWYGAMVRHYFANPLLKGKPQRGAKHTVKHHGSGRRKSVPNPKGPNYYDAPHLAHLSEEEFDELNALLAAKNALYRRQKVNGSDPLLHRSRKHSRFPGMQSRCWYCGHYHVWGANGTTESLMCNNSREWHCWHTIGFSGSEMADKLVAAICDQLPRLDQFDEQFAAMVEAAGTGFESQFTDDWKQLRHDEEILAKEKANLLATIRELGPRSMLIQEADAVEAKEKELLLSKHRLERRSESRPKYPQSPSALRCMLEEEFGRLTNESTNFAHLMRGLVPEIYVYAVRLCDGGHLLPRAKVKLNLAGSFPEVNIVPGLGELLNQDLTLDLFNPPQRARIRVESVRLAAEGLGPKAIAQRIAEKPTSTAVQNALALDRRMELLGLTSPYVTVLEPPPDYSKLRHHKHARYEFKPLDDYQRPPL